MSYRFMRVFVFFDLPVTTNEDKRNYRVFRKKLVDYGFLMLQESVYVKMLYSQTSEKTTVSYIKEHQPPAGLVQILVVTEKQFSKMESVSTPYEGEVISGDERLIII